MDPTVIALVLDGSAYTNDDGYYILADSDLGSSLLEDSAAYSTTTVEGNFYRMAGADSVCPFKKTVIPNVVGATASSTFTYTPDWENFNRLHITYACNNYYCFLSVDESLTKTGHYSRWSSYPVSLTTNTDGTITIHGGGGSTPNIFSVVPYNV